MGDDTAAMVFDRASLPFGPMPGGPIALSEVWSRNGGWKLGLAAQAVAIGKITTHDLLQPEGWHVEEVPITE